MGWTTTGKRAKPERKPELTIPNGGKPGQFLARTVGGLEWADLPIPDGGNPGQVLVKTANGVEWEDQTMHARVYSEGNPPTSFTCDKSYSEIANAIESKRYVVVDYYELTLHLYYYFAENDIVFTSSESAGELEDGESHYFDTIIFHPDNTISYKNRIEMA